MTYLWRSFKVSHLQSAADDELPGLEGGWDAHHFEAFLPHTLSWTGQEDGARHRRISKVEQGKGSEVEQGA